MQAVTAWPFGHGLTQVPQQLLRGQCFCWCSWVILSLHFGLVYFREPQVELVEEELLVIIRLRNAAAPQVNSVASRQDNVHHSQFAQF